MYAWLYSIRWNLKSSDLIIITITTDMGICIQAQIYVHTGKARVSHNTNMGSLYTYGNPYVYRPLKISYMHMAAGTTMG